MHIYVSHLDTISERYYSVYYQNIPSSLMYVDSVSSYQLQIDLKMTTGSLYIHGRKQQQQTIKNKNHVDSNYIQTYKLYSLWCREVKDTIIQKHDTFFLHLFMITVETILKSVMRKLYCMTYPLVEQDLFCLPEFSPVCTCISRIRVIHFVKLHVDVFTLYVCDVLRHVLLSSRLGSGCHCNSI
jgi:hypothetical protein